MNIQLRRFIVQGLHGSFDIDIPIKDNKIIIVGVNGLGKTTVVNLLYFILTTQWQKTLETTFTSIGLEINGKFINLSRQDIQTKVNLIERHEKAATRWSFRTRFPSAVVQNVISHPSFFKLSKHKDSIPLDVIKEISADTGLSSDWVKAILFDAPRSLLNDANESQKDPNSVAELLNALSVSPNHNVIYLPTYRRIEQDLKSIFPYLEESELRKLRNQTEEFNNSKGRGHIELVQFGMEDVEKIIDKELFNIREKTRNKLSNLTASYLKDIIRNRADEIPAEFFRDIDDSVVELILKRVDENTLGTDDKREVKNAIRRIRNGRGSQDARDKYLAYFFSRLLEIYISLSQSEEHIRRLIETCNRYFERKHIYYDGIAFKAGVFDNHGNSLSWKALSSGEKQVASLFTHLYLSGGATQSVIIDEPELSLSVQWQKSLLPDIMKSENCSLLVAVTHSPFIFSNELDKYAVDLSKHITFNPQTNQI